MLEVRIKQSLSLSNGDPMTFIERPIAAVLLIAALAAISLFTFASIKGSQAPAVADQQSNDKGAT
jgi:putative tricarboxylic transport membrane protein